MEAKDYATPAPHAPVLKRDLKPYEAIPVEERAARIPEMKAAAIAESKRSAAVQKFLADQKAKHAAILARGPAIPKQTFPALPSEAEAAGLMTAARAGLASAIKERDRQQGAVAKGEATVRAGRKAEADAQATLSALGDTDGLIARWHAGRTAANKPAEPLPADLQRRREEHARLTVELSDAQAAAKLLTETYEAVQAALADARRHVANEVRFVLDAYAASTAIGMKRAYEQAQRQRRLLVALADAGYGLAPSARQALHDVPVTGDDTPIHHKERVVAWKTLAGELQSDAGAILLLDGENL